MANNKATIYLSFAFVILFILSMAESRVLNGKLFLPRSNKIKPLGMKDNNLILFVQLNDIL